jgi:uridine monophosphate synthetase
MKEKLILDLFNKKCIRFGEFKLKSGKTSPIYIDLKNVISYPYILNTIVELIYNKITLIDYTHVLGIPYGGIPFASVLSSKFSIPMLMMRKEIKKYGLKKLIEGEYNSYSKLIIIEDTITTGSSLKQFIEQLDKINIKPVSIITICDRRTDYKLLSNYSIRSILTIDDIISVLYKNKMIEHKIYRELYNKNEHVKTHFDSGNNHMINKLIDIIKQKQTQTCYIIEYTDYNNIIDFIKQNNKKFCILKIFSSTIEHFSYDKAMYLKKLSIEYNFMLYEGYNFNTRNTIFFNEITLNNKYYEWVDIINISFRHDDDIFKTIDYINTKYTNKISVVYESIEDTPKIKNLLKDIAIGTTNIKFKNIFRFGYSDCDIFYKYN